MTKARRWPRRAGTTWGTDASSRRSPVSLWYCHRLRVGRCASSPRLLCHGPDEFNRLPSWTNPAGKLDRSTYRTPEHRLCLHRSSPWPTGLDRAVGRIFESMLLRNGICEARGLMPFDLSPSPTYIHLAMTQLRSGGHCAPAEPITPGRPVHHAVNPFRSIRSCQLREDDKLQRLAVYCDSQQNHESSDVPCISPRPKRMSACPETGETRGDQVRQTVP